MGVKWGKVYKVADVEKPRDFDFTTTVALRYAYGLGEIAGLQVASVTEDNLDSIGQTRARKLRVHEIVLHVGTGFYF